MFRLLRALPLALAVVAVLAMTMVVGSCNTNGVAQVRVINAIPDAMAPVDLEFNGKTAISSLAFDSVYPTPSTPPTYFGVTSGLVTIEAFYHGSTTPILDTTNITLTGGDQYTMLLAGVATVPAAYLISDNNAMPSANTVKFRVINGSASSSTMYPTGLDIYILPQGQPISGIPTISALTLGQSGPGYVTFNYSAEFTVWVTPHKNTLPLFSTTYPQNNPQITTLVIVDQSNGAAVSPNMLELIDVQ
jgi:hypothetical protein